MTDFTVVKGKLYKAKIVLEGFEELASNDMIVDKLQEAGFSNIVVTGNGSEREATARWDGNDTTADIPPEITDIQEVT